MNHVVYPNVHTHSRYVPNDQATAVAATLRQLGVYAVRDEHLVVIWPQGQDFRRTAAPATPTSVVMVEFGERYDVIHVLECWWPDVAVPVAIPVPGGLVEGAAAMILRWIAEQVAAHVSL